MGGGQKSRQPGRRGRGAVKQREKRGGGGGGGGDAKKVRRKRASPCDEMREHDSDWISFFPDPCNLQQSAALQLRHDHVTVKPAWLQVEVGLDAPVVGNITHVDVISVPRLRRLGAVCTHSVSPFIFCFFLAIRVGIINGSFFFFFFFLGGGGYSKDLSSSIIIM